MTTPNEELIARLRERATFLGPELTIAILPEAADLLQSQAERIKELETDNRSLAQTVELLSVQHDEACAELAGMTTNTATDRHLVDLANDTATRLLKERDTLRAQLMDAELHTKQVERGLDKATAQLAEIEKTEPVAWSGVNFDGMAEAFSRVIEAQHSKDHPFHNPINTDAQRALRELKFIVPALKLFTLPMPTQDVAELVEALEKLARLGNGEHYGNSDGNMIARDALSKYKGATMTTLQEAAQAAMKYIRSTADYKAGHPVAIEAAEDLSDALAQQGEPVCHGCGIPAGDVHMSTCKSGKWPSRVSNGDTAAPAPKGEPVMFAWKRNDGTYHDASGTEHSCGMHPLFAHAEPEPQPAQDAAAYMINLPEPVAWFANYGGNVYTEAQLKQAVRDALDAQGVEDAARYRWLRDYLISPSTHFDDLIVSADKAETLNGVIDAAIAKGAK